MFLRDVLKRWNARPVEAATDDSGAADGCRPTPSLLEELATDPADFADLARVLRLDLRVVVETLTADHAATPADLVVRLQERADNEARLARVRALCAGVAQHLSGEIPTETTAPARPVTSSWEGGEEGGWERWTRALGGARVHRSVTERTTATAAS